MEVDYTEQLNFSDDDEQGSSSPKENSSEDQGSKSSENTENRKEADEVCNTKSSQITAQPQGAKGPYGKGPPFNQERGPSAHLPPPPKLLAQQHPPPDRQAVPGRPGPFPPSSKYLMKTKYGSKDGDNSQKSLLRWSAHGSVVKRKNDEWKNKGRLHVQRN